MSRRVALLLLLLSLGIFGVLWGSLELINRDRATLTAQFSTERFAQINEITRELEADLDGIIETLYLAGRIVQSGEPAVERQDDLEMLLSLVKPCRRLEQYDEEGWRVFSMENAAGGRAVSSEALGRAMSETAAAALRRQPGEIEMSPPISSELGWFRVFATGLPSGGAIAALVDAQDLFSKIRILTVEPASSLILLGAHGRPTPATEPELAAVLSQLETLRDQVPRYAELIRRMRAGERGMLQLTGREAESLGLGDSEVIVAYAPIQMRGGGYWSAATLTSTAPLRSLQRSIVLRMGLASGLISLCLLGIGAYVVVAARRSIAVRERLQQAAQLAHLHEKTEKILDNIPTGVMALSADGVITAVNRVLREKLPRALGAELVEAFPEAPAAVVERLRLLAEAAHQSARVQSLFGARLSLFGAEGQYNLHAVPLEPRFPEARVLLVIEDLSEVHSLESQLLRAEKLATVGVLAAGIAHEIGTPLGVVRGRAENVLRKLGGEHPQAPGVQIIVEQIDRVTRIIRQLLDFSRVKPAAVRPVVLPRLADAVAELLRYEGERRKLRLSLELPQNLPPLLADPDQLQQVLVNLIMNAYDACAAGGTVSIRASEQGPSPAALRQIRLEVRDDGCGVKEQELNQIFDPFFTTKKRGQGTGLGLTIAAQIVRDHGGQIEVESAPGQGTCVRLLWPAALSTPEGAPL